MCRCELCEAGRANTKKTAMGEKVGATMLKNVAGRKRGQATNWEINAGRDNRGATKGAQRQTKQPSGSDAMPVFATTLSSHGAARCLYLLPPRAARAASALSAEVGWVPRPELRGIRAVVEFIRQSAEPCAAPPMSPFTALLVDPPAVKAQAHLPRCSSVCGCVTRFLLQSGQEC